MVRAPCTNCIWDSMFPGFRMDSVEQRKISWPYCELNSGRPGRRPSLYRLRYPGSKDYTYDRDTGKYTKDDCAVGTGFFLIHEGLKTKHQLKEEQRKWGVGFCSCWLCRCYAHWNIVVGSTVCNWSPRSIEALRVERDVTLSLVIGQDDAANRNKFRSGSGKSW
jgi:hypothetical protein